MLDKTPGVQALAAVAMVAGACATSPHPFAPTALPKGESQLMFSSGFGSSHWSSGWGPHVGAAWRTGTGLIEIAADGELQYIVYGVVHEVLTESLGGEVRLHALRAPISIVPLAGMRAILFGSHTLEWAPEAGLGIGAGSGLLSGGLTLRAIWRNAALRPFDGVLQLTAQAGVCWRAKQGRLPIFVGVGGGLEPDHRRTAVWPELAIGYGF
jgi:hypothetical protein